MNTSRIAHNDPSDHVDQSRSADQQSERAGHRAEVGADVDRVGDEKKRNDPLQQPVGIVLAQIAGDPFPRRTADPGADLLDRRDQRVGEQHDPRDREAELGAGLAIGRDSAGVIVGRSRDEPRAEHADETRLFRIGRGSGTNPPCCYRHGIVSAPLGDDGTSATRKPNREIAAEAGR